MASHNDLGDYGEQLAIKYLVDKEYTILAKNWRYLKAEIDIIALKKDTLAIIEVKTRTSSYFGNPESFVTSSKIKHLLKATNAYIEQQNVDYNVRFDIIAILKNNQETTLKHIKDAFTAFD